MNAKFVLRAVVFSLAGSILIFLLVGQVLADSFEISSSRTIAGKPEQVRALLTDLSTWKDWSAYRFDCGAPTEVVVQGEPATAGHRIECSGPRAHAVFELTAVQDGALEFRIRHAGKEKGVVSGGVLTGRIEWQATDDGCKVTWTESGKLDGLFQRWINWFGAHQEMVKRVQGASLSGLEGHFRALGENEQQTEPADKK